MPSELRILDVRTHEEQDTIRVTARVAKDSFARDLWFRLPVGGYLDNPHDALLICHLLAAMRTGRDLRMDGCITPSLLPHLERIQEIYQCWDPRQFRRVALHVTAGPATPGTATGVASFFTGGVDSFHTLLRHLDEITHIIYIWGFDVHCENTRLRPVVTRMLRAVAARYGKTLVEVETNIRDRRFSDLYDNTYTGLYVPYTAGAGLAAAATLLSGRIRKVYVPSSHTYLEMPPWSSHPLVDPLWGSDNLEIVHDGAHATRFEKTRYVAQQIAPLQWLRVCAENRDLAYNCGKCEKCLRTMVQLRILGMLEPCTTFAQPLRLRRVMLINSTCESARAFMQENLAAAKAMGRDRALVWALRFSMSNVLSWGPWRLARRLSTGLRNRAYCRIPENLRMPG